MSANRAVRYRSRRARYAQGTSLGALALLLWGCGGGTEQASFDGEPQAGAPLAVAGAEALGGASGSSSAGGLESPVGGSVAAGGPTVGGSGGSQSAGGTGGSAGVGGSPVAGSGGAPPLGGSGGGSAAGSGPIGGTAHGGNPAGGSGGSGGSAPDPDACQILKVKEGACGAACTISFERCGTDPPTEARWLASKSSLIWECSVASPLQCSDAEFRAEFWLANECCATE
jgi:hypothetical protein